MALSLGYIVAGAILIEAASRKTDCRLSVTPAWRSSSKAARGRAAAPSWPAP